MSVEKQIEEVMELVQELMNAQSSSQRIREKKTLESKLRALLSSAQSVEQTKSAEAMQAARNGGCGCCSNACADREDGCRHIHENPSEADMRPVPAWEVERYAKVIESLELLENGALNVAENAKNSGDDYGGGYAKAMAKMARDTLTLLGVAASQPNGEAEHG